MTAKHSPAPWVVHKEPEYGSGYMDANMAPYVIQAGDEYLVAAVIGDVDAIDAEANARLIAASPRLLAALETLWVQAETAAQMGDLPLAIMPETLEAARAAIAEATGETP